MNFNTKVHHNSTQKPYDKSNVTSITSASLLDQQYLIPLFQGKKKEIINSLKQNIITKGKNDSKSRMDFPQKLLPKSKLIKKKKLQPEKTTPNTLICIPGLWENKRKQKRKALNANCILKNCSTRLGKKLLCTPEIP